jgi:integrase
VGRGTGDAQGRQSDSSLRLENSIPAIKPSKKGIPTHPKWHFTNEQLNRLLPELRSARDKAMVLVGSYVGFRISELLSWRLSDVLDADGSIKDVVVVESKRLKGGRHIPKAPTRPEGHPDLCCCADCKRFQGELPAKTRRAPDDRAVFLSTGAKRALQAMIDLLAKTRTGLTDGSRYVFESRKHAKDGGSKGLSRQQAWFVIKTAARRAGLAHLERIGTHSLRKSAARRFLEASGNDTSKTAAFLGHRNPATTSACILHDGFELFQSMQVMGNAMFDSVAA